MPDLLLELRSEEIPARMQRRAAEDLRRLVTDALVAQGFLYEGAKAFATPRRLALHVAGLPPRGQALREERRGPRVGAPEAAVQGFLKSAGLASLDQARTIEDPKKGTFYLAVIEREGRATLDVLAEIIPDVIRNFPWPKSMRWGVGVPRITGGAGGYGIPTGGYGVGEFALARTEPPLRWVRPLQSIVATFGPETETPDVVRFEVGGIISGTETVGHRFLAPDRIEVRRFDDYVPALERARVVLDAERRKDIILHDARDLAFARGLDLVEDDGLLEEVAGLVEWPVVLMGGFDAGFLDIPAEAVRATIRANQKCFVLREAGSERLAPAFVLVSNLLASDGGAAIVAGNERVVRARLSDAKFFWDTDRAVPLESRLPKLDSIVFHEKLGTQGQRVARIAALARALAPAVCADPDLAERAARLAKADLVTEMVGEFPELQGLMGARYAALQGEPASVCAAIEDHYRPLGPSDRVPTDPVAVAVALADKLDTLVGFWAINEKPTGSKDPYALRRAALGVIRLVSEGLRLRLIDAIESHQPLVHADIQAAYLINAGSGLKTYGRASVGREYHGRSIDSEIIDLLGFFADRLKVYLREKGARYDLIDAVFALPGQDDLLMVVRRVEALAAFLDTDDGRNLLAGYKRAANILRIEEKRDGRAFDGVPDPARAVEPEERALAGAQAAAEDRAAEAVGAEGFAGAMRALSALRAPADAFFERATANAEDPQLRETRLRLLAGLRTATRAVADFSLIAG